MAKASEMIARLQALIDAQGDVEVAAIFGDNREIEPQYNYAYLQDAHRVDDAQLYVVADSNQ